jgi:hypothetical protein
VAAARKTLDEARAREHAVALAWEKEKTIACHLEHQLTTAQGIATPQDNDDDCSNDASSNLDAALAAHTIGGHDLSGTFVPHYNRWRDLVLLTLRRYTLDDNILYDVVNLFI